jgi:hypothetical protein
VTGVVARVLRIGEALQQKLIVAIAERERQVAGFKDVSSTIESSVKSLWKQQIVAWQADPENAPNPYMLTRKGTWWRISDDTTLMHFPGRLPNRGRGSPGGQERRGYCHPRRDVPPAGPQRHGVPRCGIAD